MGLCVGRAQRDRFLEHAFGFVQLALQLQCARQHQARLRRGDSERDRTTGGRFGFTGVAKIAFGRSKVMPGDAIVRLRRQQRAQFCGVGSPAVHYQDECALRRRVQRSAE